MLETLNPRYECLICGTLFDEPCVRSYLEDMNGEGAFQRFFVPYCPCCGSEEFELLPEPDDDLTAEEEAEINRRDFEAFEWRREHT